MVLPAGVASLGALLVFMIASMWLMRLLYPVVIRNAPYVVMLVLMTLGYGGILTYYHLKYA